MVLLADVGGLTGVRDTLNSISVPPEVMDQIATLLDTTAAGIDVQEFTPVKGDWFGGSNSAASLGIHTNKAHAKIKEALLEGIAKIQDATYAVTTFEKELSAADGDSDVAARTLLARTQQPAHPMDGDRNAPPTQHNAPGSDQ